jgi:hypothetical protein
MLKCPNKNSQEWRYLVENVGEVNAYKIFIANGDELPDIGSAQDIVKSFEDNVHYNLKVIDSLLNISDKRKTIRTNTKDKPYIEENLTKSLSGLGVPSEQISLMFDYMKDNNITSISTEELAIDIAKHFGFVVKADVAKEDKRQYGQDFELDGSFNKENFDLNGNFYQELYDESDISSDTIYTKNNKKISKSEFLTAQTIAIDEYKEGNNSIKPTQIYSNLTVPGGTNYTENEIGTPQVTPNIKGHAQFATDNGIGWFRSDEQGKIDTKKVMASRDMYAESAGVEYDNISDSLPEEITREYYVESKLKEYDEEGNEDEVRYEGSKTRRILEVQSDLFQKGRDKKDLIGKDRPNLRLFNANIESQTKSDKNQFLQLLNKDNNWVKFFIKTIVQDSGKKGYESILFPTGDTAAKIEGHQTLEEFKKSKQKQIEGIDKNIVRITNNPEVLIEGVTLEEAIKSKNREKKVLKQELADVESGQTQLSSIAKFYEEQVGNILKKEYGTAVKRITDEHGNDWWALTTPKDTSILFALDGTQDTKAEEKDVKGLVEKLNDFFIKHGISLNAVENIKEKYGVDAVAVANMFTNTIEYLNNKKGLEAVPEEIGHFVVEILGKDHKYVSRALELVKQHPKYQEVYDEYFAVYGNELDVQKEALGKLLGEKLLSDSKDGSIDSILTAIWGAFKRFLNTLMGNGYKNELNGIISKMSQDTFEGNIDTNEDKSGVYYSKTKSSDVKIAEKSVKALFSRLKSLENRPGDLAKERAASVKSSIARIKNQIKDGAIDLAINSFVAEFGAEVSIFYNAKKTGALQRKTFVFNNIQLNNAINFVGNYESLVNEMMTILESAEFSEEYSKQYEKLEELKNTFDKIKRQINRIREENFDKLVSERILSDNKEDVLSHIQNDVSGWRAFVGSIRHSSNEVLRIASKLVEDAVTMVKMHSNEISSNLIASRKEFKDAGFTENQMMEKSGKGYSGFFISEYNRGEFNLRLKETQEAVVAILGLEHYGEVNPKTLTKSQLKRYNSIWSKFLKANTVEGKPDTPHPKYKNTEFIGLMNQPAFRKYYDTLFELRKEDLGKLPARYNTTNNLYRVPQIRKNLIDVYKTKGVGAGKLFTELFKRVEDDTEFGHSEVVTDFEGKEIRMIPIHYFNPVEANDLSTDLTYMSIAFSEMAENYKQMSKVSGDTNLIKESIKTQQFKSGRNRSKPGSESNTLKALDNMIDAQVFGISSEKLVVKGYDITKTVMTFNDYVRKNNLGLNQFTALAAYGKGSIDSKIEDVEGVYTTQQSKIFAEGEYLKNAPEALLQAGRARQTNKMQLAFESVDLFGSAIRRYRNLNANRLERFALSDDFWYSPYMIVDHRLKGKLALSMMHNFRNVDGEWMFKYEFKQKGLEGDWNSYTNYYDSLSTEGNKVIHDKSIKDADRIKMYNSIQHVADKIDGKLGDMDRGYLHRQVLGQLILTHRGWLISGIDARGKKKGYNYSTGIEEEGYYRTMMTLVGRISQHMFNKIKKQETNLDKMTPIEKRAFARTVADFAFLALLVTATTLMYSHWADDDDYTKDFLIYLAHRVQLEHIAFLNPTEIINLIKSPVAAVNQVNNINHLFYGLFDFGEQNTIHKGAFKGMTSRERALIKLMPGIRQYWALQDPASKTNYLRASFFN